MKKSCLLLALLALFAVACGDDDAPKAPNLALASLTVSKGTLTPAFDPAVTAYTVSVSNTVDQITVTGVAADSSATVVVDPESPSTLKSGSNLIMVWVFSAAGTDFKIYRLSVVREISTNANLASLSLSTGTLMPAFNPAISEYTVSGYIANEIDNIYLSAVPENPGSIISYLSGQMSPLSAGSNSITVRVTAEDGITAKDYTINIYRMGADYISPNIGTLKYIPAGTFQRNSVAANISFVSSFRMSRTEITRSQYSWVMGTDPSNVSSSTGTSDPVQMVNWYHAITFCNKLSSFEGLTPVYTVSGVNLVQVLHENVPTTENATWNAATANWSANGYRLPTEMEWMWAAMGANIGSDPFGTNTTGYSKAFAGSTGSNPYQAYAWTGRSTTCPVGYKLPNELGLYDMSGNVFERCWDWYGTYPVGYQVNYKGAVSGTYRVAHGGSINGSDFYITVAFRNYTISPSSRNDFFGFRVVRP